MSDTTANAGKAWLRSLGLTLEREYVLDHTVVVTGVPTTLVPILRANPIIDYVEPVLRGTYMAQDTTWNVRRVRAPEAWSSATGTNVKLLIIDSGIRNDHPDLSPAVVQACDGSDGVDQLGHGTFVSGVAAAVNNARDVIGVAHGVALWSSSVGTPDPDVSYVRCAVEFGRVNGTFAINMSLALPSYAALTDQIKAAYAEGLFLVAAVGNNDAGPVEYPANLFEVVAVTATDEFDRRYALAAVGSEIELAAPGVTVMSTSSPSGSVCTNGGFTWWCTGTSFAAPHVAAGAAILKSFNPNWTNIDIRDRLQRAAVDLGDAGRDIFFGYGLLDIAAAAPTLDVTMSGPSSIFSPGTYKWDAHPTGGPGEPYLYQWFVTWHKTGEESVLGTSQSQSLTLKRTEGNFTIRVRVTSRGFEAWASKSVFQGFSSTVTASR